MPWYYKSCPVIKLDKDTSKSDAKVDDPIDKVELTHFEPLYCNTWPDDKLVKVTSVSPDNVEVKVKLEFTHLPLIYCNIWFAVGVAILKPLKKCVYLCVFP